MKHLAFPGAFLALLALSLALAACGGDGPAATESSLLPAGILIQKGPAVAAIGSGRGGDGGPALQPDTKAIGITGTGYGRVTAPADAAVVQFAISGWPKGYGPAAGACGDCPALLAQPTINVGDLLTEAHLRTVIDAVVSAGGDRNSLKIDAQPMFNNTQLEGTLSVTVRDIGNVVTVAQAGMDAIAALTDITATLANTSVRYQVTACPALRRAAGQAAAEDAAGNAAAIGALLGMDIGAITGASNYIIQSGYQQPGEADCSGGGGSIVFTPGMGLTGPPSKVEVAAQISVTYALR